MFKLSHRLPEPEEDEAKALDWYSRTKSLLLGALGLEGTLTKTNDPTWEAEVTCLISLISKRSDGIVL